MNNNGTEVTGETMRPESNEGWYGHLVDVFHPFLLETLIPSHFVCYLDLREVKEMSFELQQLEDKGEITVATSKLLEAIKHSKEPGKWTSFFQALDLAGCEIVSTILEEKQENNPWHFEHKRLIEVFSRNIAEKLALQDILPKLRIILSDMDYEKIDTMRKNGKEQNAIHLLLLLMHRRHSDWYRIFLKALIETESKIWNSRKPIRTADSKDHIPLSQLIDPDFVEKLMNETLAIQGNSLDSVAEDSAENMVDTDSLSPRPVSTDEMFISSSEEFASHSELPVDFQPMDTGSSCDRVKKPRVSSCECGCCADVLAELSSHKMELASLRNEIMELKVILMKNLK